MKFLRVIRFDQSDEHVFARPAAVDEWAVSGAFEFIGLDPVQLVGKTRQAFANGFLALPSFGRSTFAMIAEMGPDDHAGIVDALAEHFVKAYGAPGMEEARAAATDEVGFVRELCAGKPVNTVLTVRRVLDGEDIREEFREISPPGEPRHARIWDVVEEDDA